MNKKASDIGDQATQIIKTCETERREKINAYKIKLLDTLIKGQKQDELILDSKHTFSSEDKF